LISILFIYLILFIINNSSIPFEINKEKNEIFFSKLCLKCWLSLSQWFFFFLILIFYSIMSKNGNIDRWLFSGSKIQICVTIYWKKKQQQMSLFALVFCLFLHLLLLKLFSFYHENCESMQTIVFLDTLLL
jgi:hypothetical protein